MDVELLHYTELGFDGEQERTSVTFVDDENEISFKVKGKTSAKIRKCKNNVDGLTQILLGFRDIDVGHIESIKINGVAV